MKIQHTAPRVPIAGIKSGKFDPFVELAGLPVYKIKRARRGCAIIKYIPPDYRKKVKVIVAPDMGSLRDELYKLRMDALNYK
jgi:hypothetical protein